MHEKPLDIAAVKYFADLSLVNPDGTLFARLDLTPMVQAMQWEEQQGELAARAQLTLRNAETDLGFMLHELAYVGNFITLRAEWNDGNAVVFHGMIYQWEIQDG